LILVALLGATVACNPVVEGRPTVDSAASEQLTVTHVVDGDTVDLSDGRRVRVLGIDTPEMDPVECWGPEATEFARSTLLDKPVTVTGDPTQDAVDQYGRTLAYLTFDGGSDYSTETAGAGMARARTYGDRPVQRAPQIEAAEQRARAAGLGLWGAGCEQQAATTPAIVAAQPSAQTPRARVMTTRPAPTPTRTRRATPTRTPAPRARTLAVDGRLAHPD
jgi:micrococcal nuclease